MKSDSDSEYEFNFDTSRWSKVGNNNYVVDERISLDGNGGVDDIVTYLSDTVRAAHIQIWSGVHGSPSGALQVDDPDFKESDAEELEQDEQGLKIEVELMTTDSDGIPDTLKTSLDDETIYVVLAWCYSKDYLSYNHYPE